MHINRIRQRMHYSHQHCTPRDPLVKHVEHGVTPPRQPNQKIIPTREQEEHW